MGFKYFILFFIVIVGFTISTQAISADIVVEWQPGDNSANIQKAIDSGNYKVIIPKTDQPWLVGNPIYATKPNQIIIFEPGVVVLAQKGAFKAKFQSLITVLADNVTLSGYGATLEMRKADYANPNLYEKSEWRHNISVRGAKNFVIEGFTLSNSGGDGIYVGSRLNKEHQLPESKFSSGMIRNVVAVDNYRQGLSIISAKNLLIENSTFKNTSGTNPASGVDLEPNYDWEQLVNIRFRNTNFTNNQRNGIKIALWHYHGAAVSDIDISFDGCQSQGNGRYGIDIQGIDDGFYNGPQGNIRFKNCTITNSGEHGIFIRNDQINPLKTFNITFENTSVINTATKSEEFFPVYLDNTIEPGGIGNIDFGDNFLIKDHKKRPPLVASYFAQKHGLFNINGTITTKNSHQKTPEIGQNLLNFTLEFLEF